MPNCPPPSAPRTTSTCPTDGVATIKEVADFLRLNESTVRRYCHQSEVDAFQVTPGGAWRIVMRHGRPAPPKGRNCTCGAEAQQAA
jgi:hypothetical protein